MKEQLKKLITAFASMFQDDNPADGVIPFSIGRAAFGLLFVLCCYFWVHIQKDPPSTMTTTLWALLAYVTSSKVIDLIPGKKPE
jgi:hypothetical protein